jgi:transcription elongation factor
MNCSKKSNFNIENRVLHMENTNLSTMFFSNENMERIQKLIKREIYIRTNGKIKLQIDSEMLDLQVIMNSIYDTHAKHLPCQIIKQVKILNMHVVNSIVPNAITMIDQSSKYIKQLDKPIQTIDRPINVNNGGRKTLPSFTSVMGF